MTRDEVAAKIRTITATFLNIDEAKVTEDAHFVRDLGTDSLSQVELIINFEEEFWGVSDEQAERCLTVRDAIELFFHAGGES